MLIDYNNADSVITDAIRLRKGGRNVSKKRCLVYVY